MRRVNNPCAQLCTAKPVRKCVRLVELFVLAQKNICAQERAQPVRKRTHASLSLERRAACAGPASARATIDAS